MVSILALWLPIFLSAVFVFVVSSVFHMLLPYHKTDFSSVSDEGRLQDELRQAGLAPGEYMLPYAGTTKEMGSPEYIERVTRGPVAIISVGRSGPPSMARPLTLWFLYSLAVSYVAAYIAGRALGPGAEYLAVFRFVTTTAFVGYVFGVWQQSIWFFRPWSTTMKTTLDGLVYALVTAGVFGWLWP